jgi:hypothetical protein
MFQHLHKPARGWLLGMFMLVCAFLLLGAGLWGALNPAVRTQAAAPHGAARTANNRIVTENALPGTDEWADIGWNDPPKLNAYAGATSVNAGAPISIYVNNAGSSITWRLYRLGYYQNHGARLITTGGPVSTAPQPACTRTSSTGLVRCPWAAAFTLPTNAAWVSGIYLLRMDSDQGRRIFVYFTVRNDSYNADFVFQEASMTNQAYNDYGGESLYLSRNNEGRPRGYQVSFDRPYADGAGTGSFFTHDVDMLRWVEASGYDVTYISDVDTATNPNILLNHKVVLEVGHPEYWTWGERDNVENALAAGVNMVFASANETYWSVRLESSPVGPNRIITCYKDPALDPTHTAPYTTVEFDGPILQRPDNILVGVGYQSYYDDARYNYPWVISAPATRWYFDCTGLQPGDQVNNIIGEEWAAIHNNGHTPPGIDVISSGTVINAHGVALAQNSAIYTAASGAQVFAAGSIHFAWGLIDHSYPNQVFPSYALSNDADHRVEQFMANILDNFAGYWDGSPRTCGGQGYYDVGTRATRTPMPQVPTATGTPPTATRTPTRTPTPVSGTATNTPVGTPTNTPTATPTTPPVQGAITTGDPTQAGRFVRDWTVASCGTVKTVPGNGDMLAHHYDAYNFVNNTGSSQCITVRLTTACTGTNDIFSAAYLGSFTPANIVTNYRSDIGASPGQLGGSSTYGFDVPAGQTFVVTVYEVTANAGCGSYTLAVTGGSPVGGATSTPTATAAATYTPTATGTATASATPSRTATATSTATRTATPTNTPVPPSATATAIPSATSTAIPTGTATDTPLPTATATRTPSHTATVPPTATDTPAASPSSTSTATATVSPTHTATAVPPTRTATATVTATAPPNSTATRTATSTRTATRTPTSTRTTTPTRTATRTPVSTATRTPTGIPTHTPTGIATSTATRTPMGTGTATPTVTATPGGGPQPIQGAITSGDPTQAGRIVRDWVPSTCSTVKTVPGNGDMLAHHYDAYTFANTTGSSQCITVQLTSPCAGTNDIFSIAYLNSFDPANITANYRGDIGWSPGQDTGSNSYSFTVAAGQPFVVTVYEVTANGGCGSYTLNVTGGSPTAPGK